MNNVGKTWWFKRQTLDVIGVFGNGLYLQVYENDGGCPRWRMRNWKPTHKDILKGTSQNHPRTESDAIWHLPYQPLFFAFEIYPANINTGNSPCLGQLPSGKQPHNYGKSPFFMGKLTISMAIFHSYFDITRGYVQRPGEHRCVLEAQGVQGHSLCTVLLPFADLRRG